MLRTSKYSWDGENRLIQMLSLSGAPAASKRQLVFAYDFLGRRTRKTVYDGSSGSYVLISSVRFIYDGWNLLVELDSTNNPPIRSYLWGQDLSGTMDKAGGIGGLQAVRDHTAGTYHFAAYDGSGNLITFVSAGDESRSADYEYSPFGEAIRVTGPLGKANPFRWSTKYWDDEAALVYYGGRFYSPVLGRWVSSDPAGISGGNNLTRL